MMNLPFPPPDFRLKKEGGKRYVFDGIRKTWLLLTAEEWVRQNMVAYLTKALHYPASLVALEKEIVLNGLKKRFDLLVYDTAHQPWMMVECKAQQVALGEDVLQQALRYTIVLPVKFIVITNGEATIGWKRERDGLRLLTEMPLMG